VRSSRQPALHRHRALAARGAKRARICATAGLRLPRVSRHEPEGLSDADLARAGEPFDAVLLDTFASGDTLAQLLEHARRVLTPGGRLWIFERYESLERSRERIVEHPLARLRRLLGEAGLTCERLSPVEADGEHVLAAVARPATAVSGTAGARR